MPVTRFFSTAVANTGITGMQSFSLLSISPNRQIPKQGITVKFCKHNQQVRHGWHYETRFSRLNIFRRFRLFFFVARLSDSRIRRSIRFDLSFTPHLHRFPFQRLFSKTTCQEMREKIENEEKGSSAETSGSETVCVYIFVFVPHFAALRRDGTSAAEAERGK